MNDLIGERGYYVYLLINTINGKLYVGKTRRTLEKRAEGHRHSPNNPRAKNTYIARAIAKYGFDNFKMELLEECDDEEHMQEREVYWILNKKSYISNIGYNLKTEKDGGTEFLDDEKKLAISRANRRNKRPASESPYGICVAKDRNKFCSKVNHLGDRFYRFFDNLADAQESSDKLVYYFFNDDKIKYNFPEKVNKYTEDDLYFNFCSFRILESALDRSEYNGVGFKTNKWIAKFKFHEKIYFLGFYDNEIEAARAVDKARFSFRGENSRFYNFPEETKSLNKEDCKKWFEINRRGIPNVSWDASQNKYICLMEGKVIKGSESLEEAIMASDMMNLSSKNMNKIYYKEKIPEYNNNLDKFLKEIDDKQKRYTGVLRREKNGKVRFEIILVHNKICYNFGSRHTEEDAALVYDFHVRKMGLEKEKTLNFPDITLESLPEREHKSHCAKKIFCKETGEVYRSMIKAAEATGINRLTIKRAILREQEVGGYNFSFV